MSSEAERFRGPARNQRFQVLSTVMGMLPPRSPPQLRLTRKISEKEANDGQHEEDQDEDSGNAHRDTGDALQADDAGDDC